MTPLLPSMMLELAFSLKVRQCFENEAKMFWFLSEFIVTYDSCHNVPGVVLTRWSGISRTLIAQKRLRIEVLFSADANPVGLESMQGVSAVKLRSVIVKL